MQSETGASFSSAFQAARQRRRHKQSDLHRAPAAGAGFYKLKSHSCHKENLFPGTFEPISAERQITFSPNNYGGSNKATVCGIYSVVFMVWLASWITIMIWL